jgi:hypothetical protein
VKKAMHIKKSQNRLSLLDNYIRKPICFSRVGIHLKIQLHPTEPAENLAILVGCIIKSNLSPILPHSSCCLMVDKVVILSSSVTMEIPKLK